MPSLRSKILTSYGLSTAALVVFVAIVIGDLHYLRTHVVEGEAVSDLYVASEKIRREEKNLFLYDELEDLYQLQSQLDVASNALGLGKRVLSAIVDPEELSQIETVLQNYSDQLDKYMDLPDAMRIAAQPGIRETGHELTELTQDLNARQREILTNTIRVAAQTLFIASITVILLGMLSAMFIVSRIVRPLRQLEKQLDQLAEGKLQALTRPSNDTEIQSFVFHFNSMLEQLRTQQDQLRRHERAAALGVLVSGVAHELNNPLSNISTSVQLLLEDDGTTNQQLREQWLSHIDGESERARRIVKRLLDSVRQPTKQMQLYDAARLVQGAMLLIHRQLAPDLFLHIENIEPGILRVDRDRMQEVFINLVRNAAQAGARNIWITGTETTWVSSKPVNTSNLAGDTTGITRFTNVMLMQVEDDGPGIAEDYLLKIFDPFFTTKSSGEGTGLGLYLVEEIISEHRGCITVENRPEGGTRFSIWLPLEQASGHAQEAT